MDTTDLDKEDTRRIKLILGAISENNRKNLMSQGVLKSWIKGETIFHRGDPGDYIVAIRTGIAEVSITSLNGRKSILNHMHANDILGEIALLDGGMRSADVIAITDLTGVVVPQRQVQQYLKENPEAVFDLIDQLCEKVRNASDMFETHALTSASARLARCLIRFGQKWGQLDDDGSTVITQQFSQSDLGEFSGLARENVNRYVSQWSQEGLISFDRGQITLHDLTRLPMAILTR